jgi:hypothetical protein
MFVSRERYNEALERIRALEEERRILLDRISMQAGMRPLYAPTAYVQEDVAEPEEVFEVPGKVTRADIRALASVAVRKKAGLPVPISPAVQADLERAEIEGRKAARG